MGNYHKTITLVLAAAVANGVSTLQTPGAAGNLTITGSLASGGVATFDVARRVLVTTVSNESGKTLTITGTDRYGRAQAETITGPNATTGYTTKDFLTVTQVAVSAAFTGAVTVGTNGVGSSDPYIVDRFSSSGLIQAALAITGTVNVDVQVSLDDFSPAWDMTGTQPTWFSVNGLSGIVGTSMGSVTQPISMLRLLQNSGTGTSVLTVNFPVGYVGG